MIPSLRKMRLTCGSSSAEFWSLRRRICATFGVLVAMLLPACAGRAAGDSTRQQNWHTPKPSYPVAAIRDRIWGAGVFDVRTGADGHVDAVTIVSSTGSKVLDENTIRFARNHWTGPANTHREIPAIYQRR